MADEGDSKSLVLITRVGSTPTTGIKNGSKLTWSYFYNAPSPSGKAGDFDSPIVGSTPAGATENTSERFQNGVIQTCFFLSSENQYVFSGKTSRFKPFRI